MAPTNREANIVFKIDGANQSRQEVDKVRKAFEDFGDAGKQAAQPAVDGLEAIQRGVDKVEKKIAQGRTVTVRDVGEMAVNFKRLEDTIVKTFGSIEKAPAGIQASWKLAGDQLKRVESEVVKSNKAIEDQRNVTNQAGASWTGWGNAIDNVNPKVGALVAKIGTIGAAFTAGWTAGNQLNRLFGTDMSVWEDSLSRFGAKAGAIISALSDNVVATGNLVAAIVSGNVDEIKRAWAELEEAGKKSNQTIADAVTKYGSEWDAVHPKIGKATEEVKKHRDAIDGITESIKKLKTAKDGSTQAINDELFAITLLLPKAQEHSVQLAYRARLLQELLERTDGLSKAERARIEAIADLVRKGDELSEAEKKQIERLSWATIVGQKAVESTNQQTVSLNYLAAAQSNLADQQARVIGATEDAAEAGQVYTVWKASDEEANKEYAESLSELQKKLSNEQIAYQSVGKALSDLKTSQLAWSEGVKAMTPDADAAADAMRRLKEITEETTRALSNAAGVMQNFQAATRNAAGSEPS
jgi:hypothetical protein